MISCRSFTFGLASQQSLHGVESRYSSVHCLFNLYWCHFFVSAMSPSAINGSTAHDRFESNLNLSILGLGAEYPPFQLGPEALETLANRFYPSSTA